jgi:hypothetical protein
MRPKYLQAVVVRAVVVLLSDGERRRGLKVADSSAGRLAEFFFFGSRLFAHLDAVPVLAGKGVLCLLLKALLALGQSLVPGSRLAADIYSASRAAAWSIVCGAFAGDKMGFGGATYFPTAILTSTCS